MADCLHSRQLCYKDLLNSKRLLYCKICKNRKKKDELLICVVSLLFLVVFWCIYLIFFSVGWIYILGIGALPSYKVWTCNYPSPLICLTTWKFIQRILNCLFVLIFISSLQNIVAVKVIPFHDWIVMTVWNYHSLIKTI